MVKIIHGILTATKYGLSLMLMFLAMTLNPSLFLALFVGHFCGDYLFGDMNLDIHMNCATPLFNNGGVVGTIIRWALCVPLEDVMRLRASMYSVLPSSENERIPLTQQGLNGQKLFHPFLQFIMGATPRVISLIYLIILLVWIVQRRVMICG